MPLYEDDTLEGVIRKALGGERGEMKQETAPRSFAGPHSSRTGDCLFGYRCARSLDLAIMGAVLAR